MFGIFVYAFGVMYSPGPMNMLALGAGLRRQFRESLGFFFGIALAVFTTFLAFGYAGQLIVRPRDLIYLSAVGAGYIVYLAFKILRSHASDGGSGQSRVLTFRDGLLMQLLNPKGILVALPVASIDFPASHITGAMIGAVSALLSVMAVGAPMAYGFLGQHFNRLVADRMMRAVNAAMSLLLLYVAASILWEHVVLVLLGARPY